MIAALFTLMAGSCVVYHGTRYAPEDLATGLDADRRANVQWRSADELFTGSPIVDEPAVLIADGALVERFGELRNVPRHVVVVAADVAAAKSLAHRADISTAKIEDAAAKAALLDAACRLAVSRWDGGRMEREIARGDDEFRDLCQVATALMHERDQTSLLELIVAHGKRVFESDGGGVLLVSRDEQGAEQLRPVVFELDSLPDLPLPTVSFPVGNSSMVGHAAFTKEPVVVADADALPPGTTFMASAEFNRRTGYPARSMLAVPMITQRDQVLGVVFFINRKSDPHVSVMPAVNADRYIIPFEERHVDLARSLASMAAISIENARLYVEIEHILESLVKASVSAIDARDPSTAGHSVRVAELTTSLAEAVEHVNHGPYRDVRFTDEQMRELRFAALLHDIGKVAVREDVLMKAKKLPPVLWERVDARFALIRKTLELEHQKRRADQCRSGAADPQSSARLDAQLAKELRELDRLRDVVRAANEPSISDETSAVALGDIAKRTFQTDDGHRLPYLTPDEVRYLELRGGTLDERERAEVESHVAKTGLFLRGIPWTADLKNLATYAAGHHEKLNGSGYPKRLKSEDIPIQTRMITLADVFDALTSSDRPYRRAVPVEKALEILRTDADAGLLDRDLVDIMTESKCYRAVLDEDWKRM